jgi:hypothetical protein
MDLGNGAVLCGANRVVICEEFMLVPPMASIPARHLCVGLSDTQHSLVARVPIFIGVGVGLWLSAPAAAPQWRGTPERSRSKTPAVGRE